MSTGARKGEILNLRWKDVDLERGQFVLHETKNNERRVVPLTGHAHDLLMAHKKVRRIDTDLLFPSKKGDKPYEIKKVGLRLLRKQISKIFVFTIYGTVQPLT